MPSKQFDLQSYFKDTSFGTPKALLEAQQTAWETIARLGNITCNCAMDLNVAWLGLWKDQLAHGVTWPQRLAECRTPDDVVRVQADLIGQATQDYKQEFDRLAAAGEEVARETGEAIKSAQEAARSMAEQTATAIRKSGTGSDVGEEARPQ
jgi:Phasin protein